jgi:hypothetical protein
MPLPSGSRSGYGSSIVVINLQDANKKQIFKKVFLLITYYFITVEIKVFLTNFAL